MSKKRAKDRTLIEGIKRFIRLPKENPFVFLFWTVALFLLTGIANNLCANFFSVCALACRNASEGVWMAFVNVYYLSAARATLDDLNFVPAVVVQYLLITMPWFLFSLLKDRLSSLEKALDDVDDVDARLDAIDKGERKSRQEETAELRKKNKKLRSEILGTISSRKKRLIVFRIIFFILTVCMVFSLTVDIYSRTCLKRYQIKLLEIRPFISDAEYNLLNRSWVRMKTRSDYVRLREKLDEYAYRGENADKDSAVKK